jgi:DNA-directed RNA polymerase specialized sigma24 family protein
LFIKGICTQSFRETLYPRLVAAARHALRSAPRGIVDEEDVALSALENLILGVEQGRFQQLNDQETLWRLLLILIQREAMHLLTYQRRERRGGSKVQHFASPTLSPDMNLIASAEPTPEMAVQLADECRHLLDALPDETLKSVAMLKMEGHTNQEAASILGCKVGTIERKLRVIRRLWAKL